MPSSRHSRSRSSDVSSSSDSSSSKSRSRSDGSLKRSSKSPSPKDDFRLSKEMKIRVQQVVSVSKHTVLICSTVSVYPVAMSKQELEDAMDEQHQIRMKRQGERNPMERVSESVWYGKGVVRVVRDVLLAKKFLDSDDWETTDTRNVTDAFETELVGGRRTKTAVSTTSRGNWSFNTYKNALSMAINFDQDEPCEPLEVCHEDYHKREEQPSLEDVIKLVMRSPTVSNNTIRLSTEVVLWPDLEDVADGAWVEEVREYEYRVGEDSLLEVTAYSNRSPGLNKTVEWSDDSAPLLQLNPQDRFTVKLQVIPYSPVEINSSLPTEEESVDTTDHKSPYWMMPNHAAIEKKASTPDSTEYESLLDETFQTINSTPAIPPQPIVKAEPVRSRSKTPEPKTPQLATSALHTAISPGKRRVRSDLLLKEHVPQQQPSMTLQATRMGPLGPLQTHSMTLDCEIGGEAYTITGYISYCGPKDFIPKRVLVDGKLLWQQSSDWNPTSINSSQINMSRGPNQ